MNAELLKSRVERIEREEQQHTTEDLLILVTQEEPNLKAGFFSRLFKVSIPENWTFYANTPDEIETSLRLIGFIEGRFIPHYKSHAKRYAWAEQCLLFKLQHQQEMDLNKVVDEKLLYIESCAQPQLALEILKILFERVPSSRTTRALAVAYRKAKLYTAAIELFETDLQQYSYNEVILFEFVECLLERRSASQYEHRGTATDAEYALYRLMCMQDVYDTERRKALTERAIYMILPEEMLQTRGEDTNLLADLGRGLNSFSKRVGKELGGAESDIPYSKGVIASAPKLLKNPDIVDYLSRHERAKAELETLLKDKGANFTVGLGASAYSLGLIWNYAHIDNAVLSALTFASKGNPEQFSHLQHISEATLEKARAVTRLTGYVAEQQVAMNLQHQGHVVELPKNANQAGYDLIVDGTPMQVKCSMDANYVLSHFDKYPDIPVIVNTELAAQLGNHPMVFVDADLSYAAVQDTTRSSLEYIAEFDSLADALPIPLLTVAFAAYRNFGEFNTGQVNAQTYMSNVGKETLSIAGGAFVGKVVLGAIGGFVAGPVGVAVAGGLGAYVGGIVGATGADRLNREKICKQRDVVVTHLIEFSEWFRSELLAPRVEYHRQQLHAFEDYLHQAENQITVAAQFFALQCESYLRAYNLNVWLSHKSQGTELDAVQAGWVALEASQQFLSVELQQKIAVINRELEIYKALVNPEPVTATVPQIGHA